MNKVKDFYSREPINTGRQVNVDILKMFSVFAMVVCHTVMFLNQDYGTFGYIFASHFLVDI